MIVKLEYLWLDGYETPNLRTKSKYIELEEVTLDTIPEWGFDGSSTMQAEGDSSDCILKPVKIYNTNFAPVFIVLCEVMNADGTPHETNMRSRLVELEEKYKNQEMWFGIEQEYVIMDPNTHRPYGWPDRGFPSPQGRYYCGVGGDAVKMRNIVDEHANFCLDLNIPLGGTNAEVMLSQWEYQIGPASTVDVCDDLWVARYALERVAETYDASISLTPKPIRGDWNGSGAHINFSTKRLREETDSEYIDTIIEELSNRHKEHISEYGIDNNERLTGHHETQHIDEFSSGVSDRGSSIRIPITTANTGKGYLEDRRPAANMDPYRAVAMLVETVGSVQDLIMV